MTQNLIDKVFSTELGQQCSFLFSTSDNSVFIRKEEAENYAHDILEESVPEVEVWYPSENADIQIGKRD